MKLEDCTKEELILLIRECSPFHASEMESRIKRIKSRSAWDMYEKYNVLAMEHLERYSDLFLEYSKRKTPYIPQSDLDCMNEEWNLYKKNDATAEKYYKKYERLTAYEKE